MGEGSVDQVVEYRLMARVRRGAHDLDLEVFGNVTRIGVRDIQRRILFPDRVDGLGRIVLGQRNLVAAMVLRIRSIRIVCPAKERVAVAGGNRAGNGERCLAGAGLGSLRSRYTIFIAAVGVLVQGVGDGHIGLFIFAGITGYGDGEGRGFLEPGIHCGYIRISSTSFALA